jgi:hypothetical protein
MGKIAIHKRDYSKDEIHRAVKETFSVGVAFRTVIGNVQVRLYEMLLYQYKDNQ